ncbi:MAG TPA: hypothetical protein VHX88_01495 [Solirubrobacteraceae bacterium]|jgi:hypothetical protein|nr:hypothetical protein [Solirubrobacteraceae bacterium]
MTEQLENDLRSVFADRAQDVPATATARLRQMDYRPRSVSLDPRVAVGAGAGLAATAGVVISIVGLGAGTAPAFAGWTAAPTAPTAEQSRAALQACVTRLGASSGPLASIPTSSWTPALADTRGPFTVLIITADGARAMCFGGPSFSSVSGSTTGGNSGTGFAEGSGGGSGGGGGPSGTSTFLSGPPTTAAGPIQLYEVTQRTSQAGQPFTLVDGQVASGVTAVTLVRSDGSDVQATVQGGQFVAWWPGSTGVASAQVTTASGVSTQALPAPPAGQPGPASTNVTGSGTARSYSSHRASASS